MPVQGNQPGRQPFRETGPFLEQSHTHRSGQRSHGPSLGFADNPWKLTRNSKGVIQKGFLQSPGEHCVVSSQVGDSCKSWSHELLLSLAVTGTQVKSWAWRERRKVFTFVKGKAAGSVPLVALSPSFGSVFLEAGLGSYCFFVCLALKEDLPSRIGLSAARPPLLAPSARPQPLSPWPVLVCSSSLARPCFGSCPQPSSRQEMPDVKRWKR